MGQDEISYVDEYERGLGMVYVEPDQSRIVELDVPATRKPETRVIGICGGFGAGKDTVAALLSMLGYQNASLAAGVRGEVLWHLLHNNYVLEMTIDIRAICSELRHGVRDCGIIDRIYKKPTGEHVRRLLQWWGTDYRRAQDPNYWVKQLTLGPGKWTISDVRFENEVNKIRELGGQIWRVENPRLQDEPGREHESELAIAEIMPDVVLVNDGDIHKLAITVRTAMGV